MMTAKIGSASHLFVTIRSILSDVVSFSPFFAFVTHSPIIEEMYTYLSFVMNCLFHLCLNLVILLQKFDCKESLLIIRYDS